MTSEEIIKLIDERIRLFLQLFERDFWDYAAIIAPILLSVIAIVVSIQTALQQNKIGKRQNEITLFEHRFKALSILDFLLPLAKTIIDNTKKDDKEKQDVWDILAIAMQTFKYSTSPFDKKIEFSQVEYFYTNMILEISRLPCLFKNESTESILAFSYAFKSIADNVCNGEDYEEEIFLLQKYVCEIEEKNIMDKLEKYLKL